MSRLRNKVIVITGAASGIGLAAAKLMAAEGGSVVLGDLNQEQAVAAAQEITQAGGRAIGVHVDVTDEDSVSVLLDSAVSHFGGVHVMCNHVGGSDPRKDLDLLRMDMAEFDRTMELNVRSTVLGTRAALPHMIAAGHGSIINTASIAGLSGDFMQTAYGTAKAAVMRLTQYVATQYGPQGVRCNAIAPGAVMTPALRDNLPAQAIDALRGHNALPYLGEPEDIAQAMLFLACEESRYVTGQTLIVDGGVSSHSAVAADRRSLLPDPTQT